MGTKFFSIFIGVFITSSVFAMTDVYQVSVESSMDNCRVKSPEPRDNYRTGLDEPSAILVFKRGSRTENRKIYSDLCTISAQPLSVIVMDGSGTIVGVGMANTYSTDGLLTFSRHWRSAAD